MVSQPQKFSGVRQVRVSDGQDDNLQVFTSGIDTWNNFRQDFTPDLKTTTTLGVEYFHDHARIEQMFFEGLPRLAHGMLEPDWSSPGNGLELRQADVKKFAA